MPFPVRFSPSATERDALGCAATVFGVEPEYWDIWGRRHTAPDQVLKAILSSLGVPCDSREQIDGALEERLWEEWSRPLPPALVLDAQSPEADLRLPLSGVHTPLALHLAYEDGSSFDLSVHPVELAEAGSAELRGAKFTARRLPLPAPLPLGYHRLELRSPYALRPVAAARLIACPSRAWLPAELENGCRLAGLAVSLYGLRSERNWGCGDFSDLEHFCAWLVRETGASFVALNPLHAIANRQPYNTSPYLPQCAFYRNLIYLDIERIPDFENSPLARRLRRNAALDRLLASLRAAPLVEYERIHRVKLLFLKILFRQFLRECRLWSPRALSFHRYQRAEGALLDRYAVFAALDEHIRRRNPGVWLWTDWPPPYRDPDSQESRRFARRHWVRVLFFKYVQWQIDLQLGQAQEHARACGLSIGLYHDLALATDRYGADLWAHRPFYVSGCRVGAPPDDFAPHGQDWSFPPPNSERHRADGYRLFAESIRKNARHGGALRIDHVMRFFHLFWIPDGLPAAEGTYVRDRAQDLLRILALESVRQKVILIGEDLGTVGDDVRAALDDYGILSYRLFYFEKHRDGRFRLPNEYPRRALVSSATHDLPTLAGFWSLRDLEVRRAAGLLDGGAAFQTQLAARLADKQKMLDLLFSLGLLPEWFPRSAAQVPELTGELHNAIVGFLASTQSILMVLNQEDLFKETEQQNLPGTTAEYPNWRRKMRYRLEELESVPQVRDFTLMFRNWLERSGRNR